MNFIVQYKMHMTPDFIMLSNNIIPEQKYVLVSDLLPANWYDLVMTAFSDAGSTEAQYRFSTLTIHGGEWVRHTFMLTSSSSKDLTISSWLLDYADISILRDSYDDQVGGSFLFSITSFLVHAFQERDIKPGIKKERTEKEEPELIIYSEVRESNRVFDSLVYPSRIVVHKNISLSRGMHFVFTKLLFMV